MQSSLSELFYCAKELNRNNKKGRVNVENEKLFTIIKSTILRGQFQGVWFHLVLIDWIMGLLLLRLEKADPTKSQMRVTDFIISLDSCLSPEHRFIRRHKTGNQFTTHSIYSFCEFLLTTFKSLQPFFSRKSRVFLVPLQCDVWQIWLGKTH